MNILITGHLGFIGKYFYKNLISKNKIFTYDIKSDKIFPSLKKIDLVIHLGAISSTTEKNIDKIWKYNYYFTKNLIDKCIINKTNLQIASSASVYGNQKLLKFSEKTSCLPSSPYSWSKFLIDKYLNDKVLKNLKDINIQSFRYFNVYGENELHKKDQMSPISKFKNQAETKKVIKIFYGSKNYIRDFVWVGDLFKVQEKMMTKKINGIFNIGTGKGESFLNIAKAISKKTGVKIKEIKMPNDIKANYQYYTCANNKKISNLIKNYKWMQVTEYINSKYY